MGSMIIFLSLKSSNLSVQLKLPTCSPNSQGKEISGPTLANRVHMRSTNELMQAASPFSSLASNFIWFIES